MAHRVARLLFVVVLCVAPPAAAQTVTDAIASVEQAVTRTSFAQKQPMLDAELRRHLQAVRDSGLAGKSVDDVAAALSERPKMAHLARLGSGLRPIREVVAAARDIDAALTAAGAIVDNELTAALIAAAGNAEAQKILAPWTALYRALLSQSLEDSLEKLRRFERKFGPGSAHLNGIELVANYGLQRLPHFGPDENAWPGPLEAVAAYSPTYMTIADGSGRFVSVGEFGLRVYFFGETWGRDGLAGVLRPSFMTFGMAVAGESDGALKWPWQGSARLGGFVSWGQMKVAYVAGDEQRLLVTRQFQIVPWAF